MPEREAPQIPRHLQPLDDELLQQFIVDGYVMVRTALPPEFHREILKQAERIIAEEGNPGNNILPRLPMLREVFSDPNVAGALASILGPEYFLQPHRYCHLNPPGKSGQKLHRDGFCTRRHHPRAAMAFYYPHDVTGEMGPTAIVPGSQYCNTRPAAPELPLCAEAGTVAIVEFNIWHRGTSNESNRNRAMFKFLFCRMEEPRPSGSDPGRGAWKPEGSDDLAPLWAHLWEWQRGQSGLAATGRVSRELAELLHDLGDSVEGVGFRAAYELADMGAPAVPPLVEALLSAPDAASWHTIHERLNDGGFPRFLTANASYALSSIGSAAVPALLDAARHVDWAARASVVETLGDLGTAAPEAVPALCRAVADESLPVRRHAAEALGTTSQGTCTGVPALIQALCDEDVLVRRHATLALARIGSKAGEAVPHLARALADRDRYVRGNAVHALRRVGTPAAVDTLLEFTTTARWCPLTTRESPY